MKHYSPEALIDRNLERACELAALKAISSMTSHEINQFAVFLHERLDLAIEGVLNSMETRMKINESITNPKVAK